MVMGGSGGSGDAIEASVKLTPEVDAAQVERAGGAAGDQFSASFFRRFKAQGQAALSSFAGQVAQTAEGIEQAFEAKNRQVDRMRAQAARQGPPPAQTQPPARPGFTPTQPAGVRRPGVARQRPPYDEATARADLSQRRDRERMRRQVLGQDPGLKAPSDLDREQRQAQQAATRAAAQQVRDATQQQRDAAQQQREQQRAVQAAARQAAQQQREQVRAAKAAATLQQRQQTAHDAAQRAAYGAMATAQAAGPEPYGAYQLRRNADLAHGQHERSNAWRYGWENYQQLPPTEQQRWQRQFGQQGAPQGPLPPGPPPPVPGGEGGEGDQGGGGNNPLTPRRLLRFGLGAMGLPIGIGAWGGLMFSESENRYRLAQNARASVSTGASGDDFATAVLGATKGLSVLNSEATKLAEADTHLAGSFRTTADLSERLRGQLVTARQTGISPEAMVGLQAPLISSGVFGDRGVPGMDQSQFAAMYGSIMSTTGLGQRTQDLVDAMGKLTEGIATRTGAAINAQQFGTIASVATKVGAIPGIPNEQAMSNVLGGLDQAISAPQNAYAAAIAGGAAYRQLKAQGLPVTPFTMRMITDQGISNKANLEALFPKGGDQYSIGGKLQLAAPGLSSQEILGLLPQFYKVTGKDRNNQDILQFDESKLTKSPLYDQGTGGLAGNISGAFWVGRAQAATGQNGAANPLDVARAFLAAAPESSKQTSDIQSLVTNAGKQKLPSEAISRQLTADLSGYFKSGHAMPQNATEKLNNNLVNLSNDVHDLAAALVPLIEPMTRVAESIAQHLPGGQGGPGGTAGSVLTLAGLMALILKGPGLAAKAGSALLSGAAKILPGAASSLNVGAGAGAGAGAAAAAGAGAGAGAATVAPAAAAAGTGGSALGLGGALSKLRGLGNTPLGKALGWAGAAFAVADVYNRGTQLAQHPSADNFQNTFLPAAAATLAAPAGPGAFGLAESATAMALRPLRWLGRDVIATNIDRAVGHSTPAERDAAKQAKAAATPSRVDRAAGQPDGGTAKPLSAAVDTAHAVAGSGGLLLFPHIQITELQVQRLTISELSLPSSGNGSTPGGYGAQSLSVDAARLAQQQGRQAGLKRQEQYWAQQLGGNATAGIGITPAGGFGGGGGGGGGGVADSSGAALPGSSGGGGGTGSGSSGGGTTVSPRSLVTGASGGPMNVPIVPIAGQGESNYVKSLWQIASAASNETGLSPEMILAIGANDTGWNQSANPQENRIFGETAAASYTGPTHDYTDTTYANGYPQKFQNRFKTFTSANAATQSFVQLMQSPRYAPAVARFRQSGNVAQFYADLQAAGYAEDPQWVSTMVRMVQQIRGDAQKFGLPAPGQQPSPAPTPPPPSGTSYKSPTSLKASVMARQLPAPDTYQSPYDFSRIGGTGLVDAGDHAATTTNLSTNQDGGLGGYLQAYSGGKTSRVSFDPATVFIRDPQGGTQKVQLHPRYDARLLSSESGFWSNV